ncbi:DUF3667 domain-containing protein [Marinoscillum sp.]|uniref:DUF3667 domain-containing protein n=1 Tax=Marinoscillum sp. TaxID=2024838 RepID=UPI003BAA7B2F
MKKKRRKTEVCLNCGYKLDPSFEYCPSCGQENTDNQISFAKLVNDFFANYFSLDSRFGRSIKPFFFKPGVLTKEFMDGKRVKYANPIRLYLVVSLIHFFFMNMYLNSSPKEGKVLSGGINTDEKAVLDSLKKEAQTDSLLSKNMESVEPLIAKLDVDTVTDESSGWPMSERNWKTMYKMSKEDFTVQQIEDSIHNEERGFMAQKINRQVIKIIKSDQHTLNMFIVKNIPILMFFLLPLYALILKVFFRKKLYINHVVHGLHIHSFVFILMTLYWILAMVWKPATDVVEPWIFLTLLTYIVISFRNTYHIKFVTSFLKVAFSGFLYTIVLTIGMLLEVAISLFFY